MRSKIVEHEKNYKKGSGVIFAFVHQSGENCAGTMPPKKLKQLYIKKEKAKPSFAHCIPFPGKNETGRLNPIG